jgi:hypothetical protein
MYVKYENSMIGKKVTLTEKKDSMMGYFDRGSIVTIVEETPLRGYTFQDENGNRVSEAGYGGFIVNR